MIGRLRAVGFGVLVLLGALWAGTALWLHLAGAARAGALALLVLAVLGVAGLRARRGAVAGWTGLALAALAVGAWYQTLTPREDRTWAMDVARGVKARVEGDTVTLTDLRDFDWTSVSTAVPRWITRQVDLADLRTVDMLTSVWDNPDIAHLLVSFGFEGGEQIVFSVEIRREEGESFSEVGGFFRQFELVLIGATERDIVRLRTNHRGEEVRLYPVTLDAEQRRAMFLAYVTLAQELEAAPRFYNTLTANCTTTVYRLARVLKSDLPVDVRLVLSGRLPEYLDDLGVLGGEGAVDTRRRAALITPRAQALDPAADFSPGIRRPGPGN